MSTTIQEALRQLLREEQESVNEDFLSSLPIAPLSHDSVMTFIREIPVATQSRPPFVFKLGYMREMTRDIASMYRDGGRGHTNPETGEVKPTVRILKCSEYSKLYTKAPYENLQSTKDFRKATGIEAKGEKTGFHYSDEEGSEDILNAVGRYADGSEALQAYRMKDCLIKVKYFISLDGGDLVESSKEEVAKYLTPTAANVLLNGRPESATPSADNINRFKLTGIYMIGDLGRSII